MNNCPPILSNSSLIDVRKKRDLFLFLGIFVVLLLLDQLSKLWAISVLQNKPVLSFANDFFRVVYAENHGAFLSLGSQLPESVRFFVMVVFNAIVLSAIAFFIWWKWEMPRLQRFIYGIILAGGIGNLIDRVCYNGVVIDFLNIGIGSLRSGIFNLADVWISGGVVALFFFWFMCPEIEIEEKPKRESTDEQKDFLSEKSAKTASTTASIILFLTGAFFLLPTDCFADTVVYRAGKRGGRVTISGEILDYNSDQMTFRMKSPDTVQEFTQSQILAFRADYLKQHREAISEIEKGNFDKASLAIKQVLLKEARPWIRRELIALSVQCAINLNDWGIAATQYLAMLESDPKSRNRDLIPLHWQKETLSDVDHVFAIRELTSENQTSRLIAASWLLESKDWEQRAEKALNELLYSVNQEVRNLARCQLWRVQISSGKITDGDLDRWEKQLRHLPEKHQTGPLFLLGKGYTKRVQPDLAAACFLWLTVIDSRNKKLTHQATLNAAQLLESLGQEKAGNRLRNEAKQRFTVKNQLEN